VTLPTRFTSWNKTEVNFIFLSSVAPCLLRFNSTTLFIIGGLSAINSTDRTYFYQFGDSAWTPGWTAFLMFKEKNLQFNFLVQKTTSNTRQLTIFFPGPTLNYARHLHTCGIITWTNTSTGTSRQYIVVAGGANWNAGKIL